MANMTCLRASQSISGFRLPPTSSFRGKYLLMQCSSVPEIPINKTIVGLFFKSPEIQEQLLSKLRCESAQSLTDTTTFIMNHGHPEDQTSTSTSPSTFDGHSYISKISSKSLGHVLLSAGTVTSTQEYMRQHSHILGQGSVMVADKQSSGKGRGGNTWTSPDGCLMFSASWPLKIKGSQAPFINYVISLGVTRGIEDAIREIAPALPSPLDVRIKWPNDIYTSSGLKIGGILIHTTWAQDRFNVVSGVGLNVHNHEPTTCLESLLEQAYRSASLTTSGQHQLTREILLACILARLEEALQIFENQGFSPLEESYLATWLHSGQRVTATDSVGFLASDFESSSSDSSGLFGGGASLLSSGPLSLTIIGLSPHGFLLAEDDGGRAYELTPDGNSFDMMRGLIRRKI